MSIKFLLKADADFRGVLHVREYFHFDAGFDEKGRPQYTEGRVDEDIKKEHSILYKKFADYVAANDTALYEAAKAKPGEYLDPFESEVKALVVEAPKEELIEDHYDADLPSE